MAGPDLNASTTVNAGLTVPAELSPAPAESRWLVFLRSIGTPNCWIAKALSRRFVVQSLLLLLVVQLGSFLVIDARMQRHARKALPQQLAMGTSAVDRLIDWRSEKLIEGARLLASDYGFRSAVLSNDRETIESVLDNHGARIGATEVALLDIHRKTVARAEGGSWESPDTEASVARLTSHIGAADGVSEIAVISGMPRQVVLVPLRAPVLVGWVLMYFPFPEPVIDDVHKLSGSNLTLLARNKRSDPWSVALSGLSIAQAAELSKKLTPAFTAQLAERAQLDRKASAGDEPCMTSVQIDHQEFGLRAQWLTPVPDGDAADRSEVLALMTMSVDAAAKPPRDLQIALLGTSLFGFVAFGLGSAYNAKRITTPLKSLAASAERLGSGDYVTPVYSVNTHDEVGNLARAFEQMRISVATKQEQIVQSEKLASIGQLAAGVAHEINNPIGFIFSNFGSLEDYLARLFKMLRAYKSAEEAIAGTPAAAHLARMREEIELDYLEEDIPALMSESKDGIKRVRKIVQDLKDFSHVSSRQQWELADLHHGMDLTLNIVFNEIKYKADVVKAYGDIPPVECLPSELNQVFMNLMVNAAHAIGEVRGTITLRTQVSGDEVWIEISDTGCGMAPDMLKRIFDPFFTTKPVGKGTGLGLSLSYGIVKNHGGRIEVSSEVGRGTTFRVCVPIRRAVPLEGISLT